MDALERLSGLFGDPAIEVDLLTFMFAMLVSSLVGVVVAALYQVFYEQRATGSRINRSFPLMAPSITALFIAIQFSLPLSLGLLGALSIVRFRTPIKEPEEVGFLMLLIACSVVCATLQFELLLVLLAVAVLLLFMQSRVPFIFSAKRKDGMVLLSLEGEENADASGKLMAELKRLLPNGQLERLSSADGLTTISYSFLNFQSAGIAEIESSLRKVAAIRQVNVFFNNQGAFN